jgi:hypothetical protein
LAVFFIFYSKIKNGKNFTENFQVKENSKIQNQRFQHHYKGKLTKEEGKNAQEEKKNSMNYKKNSMQMAANLFGSFTSDGCCRKRQFNRTCFRWCKSARL